jgi:small subunit ribosomal protein S14
VLLQKTTEERKWLPKVKLKELSLRKVIIDPNATDDEVIAAQKKLQKMPRDTSRIRVRNRCELTGRPRAYYRDFGLSRIKLREMAHRGMLPGVTKSSW